MRNHIFYSYGKSSVYYPENYHNKILIELSEAFNFLIIKTTLDGIIHFITPNVKDLLGYDELEFQGKPLIDYLHEKDIYDYAQYYKGFPFVKGEAKKFSIRIRKEDGSFLWTEMNIHVFGPSEHEFGGEALFSLRVIPIGRDEELLQNDKLTVIGQLAAGIAHEIRNPLTSLKGFIQLMKSDSKTHEHYLSIMENEINEIETISRELMVLAKPNPADFKVCNLISIFENSMALLEGEIFQKRVKIITKIEQRPVPVYGDEQRIKQVIINLVKNALDAMEQQGNIYIHIYSKDQFGVISIRDEGKGIPEELMSKIGKPFFTTKNNGNGLGLMMCYKIVEEHNGAIDVESTLGKGTTFTVRLPLKIR